MRLGAVALGLTLVSGSVAWIAWSSRTSSQHSGLGCWLQSDRHNFIRLIRGMEKISRGVTVMSPRRGFSATVRKEIELLDHFVAEFDRTDSKYNGLGISERVHRRGVWGPTHENVSIDLFLYPRLQVMADSFGDEGPHFASVLREQLAAAPRAPGPESWLDESFLTTGHTHRSRVMWSGYAINAATLVGLGLIGWGSVGAFVAVRAQRRAKAHQCHVCRYDLRGITQARCPECGAERIVHNAGEVSPAPPLS